MASGLSVAHAQAQRFVIVEHFTQASCGPCAAQNPALKALLDQNKSKVIPIKYQTSWPGADPMNAHNPSQVASRVSYYGVTGVPGVRLDGNVASGLPSVINQSNINSRYAVPSNFELVVSKSIVGNSIQVSAKVKKVGATSIAPVLQLVVVEREIVYNTAPGSNGETAFNFVMKRMLPSATGTTIPGSLALNDSLMFSFSWNMANVFNTSNIEVVGFLQDNGTKEILQGGYTGSIIQPTGTDASLTQLAETATPSCLNSSFVQRLRISNNGTTNLTTAAISYTVNNGPPQTQSWNGFLIPGASANLTLPTLSFVGGANAVKAYLTSVNNTTDLIQANDTMSTSHGSLIDQLSLSTNQFTFEIATDRWGSETTWNVSNSVGTNLYSGGPYSNLTVNTIQIQPTQNFTIPTNECIRLRVLDSYGDGICCAYGAGYYRLRNNGITLDSGGVFGSAAIKLFQVNLVAGSGIENELGGGKLAVYPNPSNGLVRIEMPLNGTAQIALQVYNLMGQEVMNVQDGQVNGELFVRELDLSQLAGGMYLIRLSQDGKQVVRKIELSK